MSDSRATAALCGASVPFESHRGVPQYAGADEIVVVVAAAVVEG